MTPSPWKRLEDSIHAHIVSLKNKLVTNAKNTEYMSIGYDGDPVSVQRKSTNNKTPKEKHHVRFML